MKRKQRIYDVVLLCGLVLPVAVMSVASRDSGWRKRSEIHAVGLHGVLEEWGKLEAPSVKLNPGGSIFLVDGARITNKEMSLSAQRVDVSLKAKSVWLSDLAGRVGAIDLSINRVHLGSERLIARDIEVTGSLRTRTMRRVLARTLDADRTNLERLRNRMQRSPEPKSPERAQSTESGEKRPSSQVRLRVRSVTERQGDLVLRNAELVFDSATYVRARNVIVPATGGNSLLQEVELVLAGTRHSYEEMSLDLDTWELVPRRSVAARVLGQQRGTGLRLDELEVPR